MSILASDKSFKPYPCFVGSELYFAQEVFEVFADGVMVERLSRAPRLLQGRMVELAQKAFETLRDIPEQQYYEMFRRAGDIFYSDAHSVMGETAEAHVKRAVASTGLTARAVRHALADLRAFMGRIGNIVASQSPDGLGGVYQSWETAAGYGFTPNGRTVAIRIPDNSPSSINIVWLEALAMRRPVLLVSDARLAPTVGRLVAALYQAGFPDGAVSLAFVEAEGIWARADQLIWPGKLPNFLQGTNKDVFSYHLGRGKAVLQNDYTIDEMWRRLAGMAKHNCGRVCTKLTAVLTEGDAIGAADKLAQALSSYDVYDLNDPTAVIPSFPDHAMAEALNGAIEQAMRRGAVDHSERYAGEGVIRENEGKVFLRPTVLSLSPDDPLFGAELPFPFLTVARADRDKIPEYCANSLTVNFIGNNGILLDKLLTDKTIHKILINEDIGRKDDPAEPHQGFISDYLFTKKTVSSRNYFGEEK